MSTKQLKTQNQKGIRKGWPTIKESKPIKLSDASQIIVFNPRTGRNHSLEISW
ncbi:hypothetical protein LIV57_06600 [Chryseobacterium sp. X308]|uniref:hypothetical protein n=1 Tax=Chryseobacterium sp. X308 TaxID=2884873 RepID=UPI001D153EBE|nr:hypothetical protein [Chryseobacterium sp. X308]MCC3214936.1 hypothetical protein [Chryseobacterium sp. X308]